MTENEAIERLECMRLFMQIEDKQNESKFLEDDYIANKMAIKALEEIQQYRAIGFPPEYVKEMRNHNLLISQKLREYETIGTIEEFKALKERNEPKKVIKKLDAETQIVYYRCPNCNVIVGTDITELHSNNCSCFGQSLKGY